MAITITPKGYAPKKPKPPIVVQLGLLPMFSVAIFLVVLAVSGYLWFWERQLLAKQENLKNSINELQQEESRLRQEKKEADRFLRQLENIAVLLDNHVSGATIFDFLRKNTTPDIQFSELNADYSGSNFSLSGLARSYGLLAKQIKFWQNSGDIISLTISGIGLDVQGGVKFNLSLVLNNEILKAPLLKP